MGKARAKSETLRKSPTGINGFDEITGGGLPKGRPALVCGGAGCGKTVFAAEFLVRGAQDYDEPGVFMSFEENAEELTKNFASMGLDFKNLIARKKIFMDYVYIERSEIDETGEYNLEGLFVRLEHAINSIGAKRVALDTIEALFSGLGDTAILRAELRRLFRWLKNKGVTTVITGEKGDGTLTRYGIEEYVADCVVMLDHRVVDQISTRRMRIIKYRGAGHGTNEYPFLISETGLSVLPITSLGLTYPVLDTKISSGIPALDKMLCGQGFFQGSSILLSGSAGTGKSSLAASFVNSACAEGKKCVYFAMEESMPQIVRNMRSIGIHLEPHIKKRKLVVHSARPTVTGLEMHLITMHRLIEEHRPDAVVIDPVSSLISAGISSDVKSMLTRVMDYMKGRRITSFFTDLSMTAARASEGYAEIELSSLMDTWIMVKNFEENDAFIRRIRVVKSRGMATFNLSRVFTLTDKGIRISDAPVGSVDGCGGGVK